MIYTSFRSTEAQFGNKIAVSHGKNEISYTELLSYIDETADALAIKGVSEGSLVGLYVKNSIEFIANFFAIARLGAVVLPIDIRFAHAEVLQVIEMFSLAHLICDEQSESAAAVKAECDRLILHGLEYKRDFSVLKPKSLQKQRCKFDGIYIIQYTSGSTGKPKGIVHTQRSMVNICSHVVKTWKVSQADNFLCAYVLSSAHATQNFILPSLLSGATLYVMDINRVMPRSVACLIQDKKITLFTSLPYFFNLMTQTNGITPAHFAYVRHIVSGSAPYDNTIGARFQSLFHIKLSNMYGMAELGPTHLQVVDIEGLALSSIGQPYEGVECKIMDETGVALGVNEVGELYIKTDSHALKYWNNEVETRKVFSSDGWIHTGDLASYDRNGNYTLHGRKSQVINVGGNKVSPEELEYFIARYPGVREVAVIGVYDPNISDDRIIAFIAIDETQLPSITGLKLHCKQNLANYKQIQSFIMVDALPRGEIGKVKKKELEAIYLERIELQKKDEKQYVGD